MPRQKLNVAMIGTGFIAKAHSNAFRQVGHFFDVPYKLGLKVVCGRNEASLNPGRLCGDGKRLRPTGKPWLPVLTLMLSISQCPTFCTLPSR
jgi:hypothetical protein